MTLLQALIQLKKDGPACPIHGICSNVVRIVPSLSLQGPLRALFERMGLNSDYPVCLDGWDNEDAYDLSDDKWVGAYGEARMALLDACIAKLKAEAVERIDAAMGLK